MGAGRQAEEHHAEVILDQQARRVEALEAALRAVINEVTDIPDVSDALRLKIALSACRCAEEMARKALEDS